MAEKKNIPLAAMERILKKSGADVRVSDESKIALRDVLEEYGYAVGETAYKFAMHAGRKTIKADDIKLASKQK